MIEETWARAKRAVKKKALLQERSLTKLKGIRFFSLKKTSINRRTLLPYLVGRDTARPGHWLTLLPHPSIEKNVVISAPKTFERQV